MFQINLHTLQYCMYYVLYHARRVRRELNEAGLDIDGPVDDSFLIHVIPDS